MNFSDIKLIYRKWWFWAVLAVLLLIIIIPGKRNNLNSPLALDSKNVKVYKSSDDIQLGDFKIEVLDIANLKEIETKNTNEKTNANFLVLKLSILNTGKESKQITDSMFKVRTKDESTYNVDKKISFEIKDNEGFLSKQLNPKIYTSGFLVFEVPSASDKEQYYLQVSDDKLLGEIALINLNKK